MKKKFVFHFYCGDDWRENEAVKLHLRCIQYYTHVFDDIVIVIVTDNGKNKAFLDDIKHTVIDYVDCSSLTLKTAENTPYREAKTFFDEVVNTDYDGIVFFGHTKGYTNFSNPEHNKEHLRDWILGCYWLSLESIEQVEKSLSLSTKSNNGVFFGSFQMANENGIPYLPSIYSGAFFWANVAEAKKMLSMAGKKMPVLSSRMSAEMFPGEVCILLDYAIVTSYNAFMAYADKCNFYGKDGFYGPINVIIAACGGSAEKFIEFREKILENK